MSFVEFIGLVISLTAMIFLVIKKIYDDRQRRKNPEEYARRERVREENLRKFLKERGVNFENDEEELEKTVKTTKTKAFALPNKMPSPPQKPQTLSQRKNQKPISHDPYLREISGLSSNVIPAEAYEVIREESKPKGNLVLQGLKTPRDMLIIKEIFDKPLSMR